MESTEIHEPSLSSQHDSVSITSSESPSATNDEPALPWEIRQALESLRTAIHSANKFKTTVEFLDSFPDLAEEPMDIQNGVNTIKQSYSDEKGATFQAIREAQTVFEALSLEDQQSMMLYYGEDIRYYLKIGLPLDLRVDAPEDFKNAQNSLFETENLHRTLARVRGVITTINGVAFGSSLDRLMQENRKEEQELLSSRAAAEERLQKQFFDLDAEEQDTLWLWYKDFMGMSGILKNRDGTSYSIVS